MEIVLRSRETAVNPDQYPTATSVLKYELLPTILIDVPSVANTPLSPRLAMVQGFRSIVNADMSRVAIYQMTETYKAYPMECEFCAVPSDVSSWTHARAHIKFSVITKRGSSCPRSSTT